MGLYVIKHSDGTYFHNKGKIIVYESKEQAVVYLEAFISFAMRKMSYEYGGHSAMTVPIIIQNNVDILPIDFDINKVECGIIYFKNL